MLQAGLFPDFKNADSLLIWGDAQGISKLAAAIAALSLGNTPTIKVGDLSISASDDDEQPPEVSHTGSGLVWVCPRAVLLEAEALIAGLDEAASGHQFINVTGVADQVIVSKSEYPETLRP
jgi:hypothetical protein